MLARQLKGIRRQWKLPGILMQPSGLLQKILIGSADAVFEGDLRRPAQGVQSGAVHELAGRAIGLGGIPVDASRVPEQAGHRLGQLADGEFLAGSHVDELFGRVIFHEEDQGIAQVVGMQKFAEGAPVPQQVTDGAPATLASWKRRMSAGSTCDPSGS